LFTLSHPAANAEPALNSKHSAQEPLIVKTGPLPEPSKVRKSQTNPSMIDAVAQKINVSPPAHKRPLSQKTGEINNLLRLRMRNPPQPGLHG
jgi:hypothetical protein